MVTSDVPSDRVDHVVIGVASSHEAALASDDPGHHVLLVVCTPCLLGECWQNVGMTLASTPSTRIQLCGPTVIERDGERFEGRLPGRQGRLLFAYLVLNRHRLASREELVEAIWPRELPPTAETALNALISKLRRTLGPEVIEGRSNLRMRLGEDARVDVETAAKAVHQAESQVALGEWKRAWGPSLVALLIAERDFLPGDDAPWIDEQRHGLADMRLRALEAHAAAAFGTGGTELPAAIRAGRQLVRLVPLRESGYQVLMQALASQGNVAEALDVYATLRAVLRDELGVSPSVRTQAVYDQLLHA
jgi:SARP family transcriptional regulator, regulator of embCAB operon